MRKLFFIALTLSCLSCTPDQESVRTVAAVEIALLAPADKNDLLAILRQQAAADGGLHVDDGSEKWRRFQQESNAPNEMRRTIRIGVWRGADDDDIEAAVDDMGHNGKAWVTFLKGRQPDRTAKFRRAVLAQIRMRWPDAKSLPVLPSGGLPLADDIRLTPTGYKIARSAAAQYELQPSSPLVAAD